jgi:hypothetical protein
MDSYWNDVVSHVETDLLHRYQIARMPLERAIAMSFLSREAEATESYPDMKSMSYQDLEEKDSVAGLGEIQFKISSISTLIVFLPGR